MSMFIFLQIFSHACVNIDHLGLVNYLFFILLVLF